MVGCGAVQSDGGGRRAGRAPGSGNRPLLPVLVLLLAAASTCGGEPASAPPSAGERATRPTTTAPAPQETGVQLAELSDFRGSTRGTGRFAHGPHALLDCAGCHGIPRGHRSHADVGCTDCHAPEGASREARAGADCAACHHDPERSDPCTRCHEDPAALSAAVAPRALTVASDTVRRDLPFAHSLHVGVECVACHGAGVTRVEDVSCISCHRDHHQRTADCTACHPAPGADVHDREAHGGCGGAGCHRDPVVLSLPATRSVCLVCHPSMRDHEPGRDCAPCHRLADTPDGGP